MTIHRRRNYRSEHAPDRSEDALDYFRSRRSSMNLFESTRKYPFDYSFGRPHSIERYFEKRPVQGIGSSSYTDNREFDYYLDFRINEVVGFDQPCPAFDPNRPSNEGVRHYIMILTVYPEIPKPTRYTHVNSSLNRANPPEFRFKLDRESYERATMKLELIRASCYGEMGASNGSVVVGRAIIKLSKAAKEIGKVRDMNSDLVRMLENGECRMEGVVRVSMKVSRFPVDDDDDDDNEEDKDFKLS